MTETFGARLARLRLARRVKRRADPWSQQGLADQLGVSPVSIWNWEHDWKEPGPDRIAQLARLLDVSEHYLRHGFEDPRIQQLSEAVNTLRAERSELADAVRDYLHSSIDNHHAAFARLQALVCA